MAEPERTAILPAHIGGTVEAIARLHSEHEERATPFQKFIEDLTARVGRPSFIAWLTVAMVGWVSWGDTAHDPHACGIGIYFDSLGLHDTPAGLAHKRFHQVIDLSASENQRWSAAAESFRLELKRAIWVESTGLPLVQADAV